MNNIKKFFLVSLTGVFACVLSGCEKKPLVIPTVDVESLQINLPTLPDRNSGAVRVEDEYECIDLYELSDFHGAVNEESHSKGLYIGLPKLSNYFEKKRESNKGGTIILSTGDMFQGSADSNLTRGYMVNYCMQYMGFDAMAVGNHEFDWTDEWLKKNSELKYNTAPIPYLGANILKDGEMPSFLKKSITVTRGDYKIGIIGVIGNDLENTILKSAIKNYEFVKYKDIVNAEAARLRSEEGCKAVVLLAHEAADKLEAGLDGIDAAFGGHAHTDTESTIQNGLVEVPALATRNYGQSVAHIVLKFNKDSHDFVASEKVGIEQMATVSSGLKEDANIKNIMSQYGTHIDEIKNIKLGKCDDTLALDKALKNICTRTMHEAAVASAEANPEANIDTSKIIAAYHNVNGGIRSDIEKGNITYGNVYKAFPFDNEVVLLEATGTEIRQKITNLNQYGVYKTFKSKSEIDSNEKYYIVTTDYLAFTDEFKYFKELTDEDLIRTGKIVRDEIATKIYSIDKVKNSVWATNEDCYRAVPNY